VGACASCRDVWTATDPTRLFALLVTREIPGRILDDVSEGVRSALDSGAPARPAPVRRWSVRAAGALAAGVLLALALVIFTGDGPRPGSSLGSVAELADIAPEASVALLDTPGEATVVDLTMGEARVVMIFDQELDL
jgi:hypothetical protein